MIISVGGDLGSGKSTVGRMLAKRLGIKHFSTGEFMRRMAEKKGVGILELNDIANKAFYKRDYSIDYEIDNFQKDLAKNEDDFVIDSRLAFHFIPSSLKIFLRVDEKTAGERILKEKRKDESSKDLQEMIENLRKRKELEKERYEQIYAVDRFDLNHYDIIIDTTYLTPQEVVDMIIQKIDEKNIVGVQNEQKDS